MKVWLRDLILMINNKKKKVLSKMPHFHYNKLKKDLGTVIKKKPFFLFDFLFE